MSNCNQAYLQLYEHHMTKKINLSHLFCKICCARHRLTPQGHHCLPVITPGVLGQNVIKLAQRLNVVKVVSGPQKLCLYSHISPSIHLFLRKKNLFFSCAFLVWSLWTVSQFLLLGLSSRPKIRLHRYRGRILYTEEISSSGLAVKKNLTFFFQHDTWKKWGCVVNSYSREAHTLFSKSLFRIRSNSPLVLSSRSLSATERGVWRRFVTCLF